jgi:hypothetical protein
MIESRFAIRSEFDKNRHLELVTPSTIQPFLTMIDEAEDMLLHGFARGKLNTDSGNYGETLSFRGHIFMCASLFLLSINLE